MSPSAIINSVGKGIFENSKGGTDQPKPPWHKNIQKQSRGKMMKTEFAIEVIYSVTDSDVFQPIACASGTVWYYQTQVFCIFGEGDYLHYKYPVLHASYSTALDMVQQMKKDGVRYARIAGEIVPIRD